MPKCLPDSTQLDYESLTSLEKTIYNKLVTAMPYLQGMITYDVAPYRGPVEKTKRLPDFVIFFPEDHQFRGIVIECQGGVYSQPKTKGGRHARANGIDGDMDKQGAAQDNGWLYYSASTSKESQNNLIRRVRRRMKEIVAENTSDMEAALEEIDLDELI